LRILAKTVLLAVMVAGAAQAAEPGRTRQYSAQCAAVYAAEFGVPLELVDAIIQVESAWNPYAVSNKGAAGLMQLMPETGRRFGVQNRFDVQDNIRGGVAYLAWLIRLFQGDLRLVVAAYETGEYPILLRGLAYSSEEVFRYVLRVAQVYRTLCIRSGRSPANVLVYRASGGNP
jgi:soluble lytic murein transglycosylase-like protein